MGRVSVSMVGSGSWGTALTVSLANNGADVLLWSFLESEYDDLMKHRENRKFLPGVPIPDSVRYTTKIEECASADIVVCALPSAFVGKTMGQLRPHVKDGQIVVNLSKGIDAESQLTMCSLIERELPGCKVAVLSGPSHAEEVGRGIPTTLVVGMNDVATAEYVQSVFHNKALRIYTNPDRVGVELGGSLKNVVALCAGIADGLEFGDNTKAALITRGLDEMVRLGQAMGANESTFRGLSGMGDLIVTCTSMHSRNRRAGILLGQGKTLDEVRNEINMVIEGIDACWSAKLLADKMGLELPILSAAHHVIFGGGSAREAAAALMNRSPRAEF